MRAASDASAIWLVDFEFHQPDGERPVPLCVVAHEWRSGHTIRQWLYGQPRLSVPLYPCDRHSLFVAFYASAELSCHLALEWPLPPRILDLYVEFRNLTNGRTPPTGNSLLGALTAFGIDGIDASEKKDMQELAKRGGPYTATETRALLAYCESDVIALRQLLPAMFPYIDFPRALLRGRYMPAVARMEYAGVPIDTDMLATLQEYWPDMQAGIVRRIDRAYGVYEGTTFREMQWERWLTRQGIVWPRLSSGRLCLDGDTFKDMARVYPVIDPIRELRATLGKLRHEELTVGRDGRNRTLLSAFSSRTGRNQPSTNRFIFGPSTWLRHLIQPEPGYGLAYVDWEQQEFGIGACLSGDTAMCEAYLTKDPYIAFAKQAGAVPAHATKNTHNAIREQYKQCALGVQYGMGNVSLAYRTGLPLPYARALLQAHKKTYARFWQWSDRVVDYAALSLQLSTVFGWTIHLGDTPNERSLRNYPMQANGAEMLRLACCLMTEQGVEVCAPVHDAILIHAPIEELDHAIALSCQCMQQASETVLEGFGLRTEHKPYVYPEHYRDDRGSVMLQAVQQELEQLGVSLAA